ncbi:MAG: hypothetical protein K2M68_00145 [Muribaculaceae bacterium]|nr:hypothetical protein [Muribaculaceae bacterium]
MMSGTRGRAIGAHIEQLARKGQLQEARRVGEEALAADPTDDGALAALVNVYLLIERSCIETGVTGYLDDIGHRLDELLPMMADGGRAAARHARNRLMLCPGFELMQELEVLSARDGHEAEAYTQARALYDSGQMDRRLHEMYATIIYRYGRVAMSGDDSRPVRALLLDYLSLVVPRPSRMHSLMLRLAVRVARKFADFGFTRFFELWNPATFRPDDFGPDDDGKGSLAAIAVELILDSDYAFELPRLMPMFGVAPTVVLATVREAYGRLIARQVRQGDVQRAVAMLELYGRHHAIHGADRHHNLILRQAIKTMRDDYTRHFVPFFIDWFDDDVATADNASLLNDAIDRAFAVVKGDKSRYEHLIGRLVEIYDTVAALSPDGESEVSVRRRALLMRWLEQDNEAIRRMSEMASRPGGAPTVSFWLDFADVVNDSAVRTGILALGVLRLGLLDGREVSEDAAILMRRLKACLPVADNGMGQAAEPIAAYGEVDMCAADDVALYEMTYHRLAAEALAVIYEDVNSVTMSVIGVDNRLVTVAHCNRRPVVIDTLEWPTLCDARPGDNVEVKCVDGAVVLARMVADGMPFKALKRVPGIVTERGGLILVRHRAVSKTPRLPEPGTAVSALVYLDAREEPVIYRFDVANRDDVIGMFDEAVVTVYDADSERVRFSAGPDMMSGEITGGMSVTPRRGDKLRVRYYLDYGRDVIVLDHKAADADEPTGSTRRVSGKLTVDESGNGQVRDVAVERAVIERAGVTDGMYVTCVAHHVPPSSWRAHAISAYS